jgi:hypothetical protein
LHNRVVPLLVHVLLRKWLICGSTVLAWGKYAIMFYLTTVQHIVVYLPHEVAVETQKPKNMHATVLGSVFSVMSRALPRRAEPRLTSLVSKQSMTSATAQVCISAC